MKETSQRFTFDKNSLNEPTKSQAQEVGVNEQLDQLKARFQ
jgi:hypothetical protein